MNKLYMKKQYLLAVYVFVSVIMVFSPFDMVSANAQTTNSSQSFKWSDLRNTKWVEIQSNQHKRWTLEFTDNMMTNTYYFGKSGHSYPKTYQYYLSDKIPGVFESKLVGKNTSGCYIISLIDDEIVHNQILSLTTNELRIRLSYSGDTLVLVREQQPE